VNGGKAKKKNKKQKGIMEDKNGRSFRESGDFVSEDLLFETMMNDVTDDLTASVLGNDNDDGSILSPNKFPFYSGAGLLEVQQVKEVASAIIAFNKRNEELAFDDDVIEQFLLGLGSHVRIPCLLLLLLLLILLLRSYSNNWFFRAARWHVARSQVLCGSIVPTAAHEDCVCDRDLGGGHQYAGADNGDIGNGETRRRE
jgi:hypothetical protein